MPTVTALEIKPGKKQRVRLFLDHEFALELPMFQAARLHRGQDLSGAEVQGLIDECALVNACDKAIGLLSRRQRSCEEIRRHLVKAGFADAVITAAVEKLRDQQFVDDCAFARFWIENRDAFKPMSARAIAHELYQKGVDRDVFEPLLKDIDAEDSAYRASQKQMWRYRGKARLEFRSKLNAMLRRRGFDFDTISLVISRIERELDEAQPDFFAGENET